MLPAALLALLASTSTAGAAFAEDAAPAAPAPAIVEATTVTQQAQAPQTLEFQGNAALTAPDVKTAESGGLPEGTQVRECGCGCVGVGLRSSMGVRDQSLGPVRSALQSVCPASKHTPLRSHLSPTLSRHLPPPQRHRSGATATS